MYSFVNKDLENAVQAIILAYPEHNLVVHAQKLMDYILILEARRKVKQLYEVKNIEDILFAAAHLYRLYYIENKPSSLLLARENLAPIFSTYNVSTDIQAKIFQMCEGFMGEDSLIDYLIPQKGLPDDLFADAIFIMNLANR